MLAIGNGSCILFYFRTTEWALDSAKGHLSQLYLSRSTASEAPICCGGSAFISNQALTLSRSCVNLNISLVFSNSLSHEADTVGNVLFNTNYKSVTLKWTAPCCKAFIKKYFFNVFLRDCLVETPTIPTYNALFTKS